MPLPMKIQQTLTYNTLFVAEALALVESRASSWVRAH